MAEGFKTNVELADTLRFWHLAPEVWKALENLPRTGWVNRGVENPESVKEHIIALVALARTLGEISDSEKEALTSMLEVHDWPEAIHGDEVILTDDTTEHKSRKEVKFENEQSAMREICSTLGDDGEIIMALWLRFETSPDDLASLARQLDKYQAVEKALFYEKEQHIPLFKEFLDYARKFITHPILVEKLDQLERNWNGGR